MPQESFLRGYLDKEEIALELDERISAASFEYNAAQDGSRIEAEALGRLEARKAAAAILDSGHRRFGVVEYGSGHGAPDEPGMDESTNIQRSFSHPLVGVGGAGDDAGHELVLCRTKARLRGRRSKGFWIGVKEEFRPDFGCGMFFSRDDLDRLAVALARTVVRPVRDTSGPETMYVRA